MSSWTIGVVAVPYFCWWLHLLRTLWFHFDAHSHGVGVGVVVVWRGIHGEFGCGASAEGVVMEQSLGEGMWMMVVVVVMMMNDGER